MGRLALIPAAPVLLADVDRTESAHSVRMRTSIAEVLATSPTWALPVTTLPPLLGLGGFGIDRGLDTRTGTLLEGADWIAAVDALDASDRTACLEAHPGLIVAALHAHAAGVRVGPAHTSESMLVAIDLSAAASADAPLAPVSGAGEFDDRVVAALGGAETSEHRGPEASAHRGAEGSAHRGAEGSAHSGVETSAHCGPVDTSAVRRVVDDAAGVHADLDLLGAALDLLEADGRQLGEATIVLDEDVHDVRTLCAVIGC